MKKKEKKNIIILSILFILFIIVTILVCLGLTNSIDSSVYNFIISFRSRFLDNYFRFITSCGNASYVIILLGICIVLMRNKQALYLCFSSSSSVVFNTIVKNIVRRDRPSVLRLITQGGYSYPSGHTMISMCCYGYLFYYVFNNVKNKYLRIFLLILLGILIISIPISRIYLGVHYFSDIIGGLLLGGCILFAVIKYGKIIIRGN